MGDFDPNWPHGHVTRDGRKARIICRDRRSPGFPIIALIGDGIMEAFDCFNLQGRVNGDGRLRPDDLLNAPAPKRVWEGAAVYMGPDLIPTLLNDVDLARGWSATIPGSRVTLVRIEFPAG